MEETRTLITEYPDRKDVSPENRTYSIIANRLVGMGGYQSSRVRARILDNHYLLERAANTTDGYSWESFGIESCGRPKVALDRMYDEAKSLAEEVSKYYKSKVLDLTSRGERVKGMDWHFVPDELLHRCIIE